MGLSNFEEEKAISTFIITLKAAKVGWVSLAALVVTLLLSGPLQSQSQLYSEAPIVFEKGVRKSA